MSSTNKTANLKLNSWIGSDKPKRTDFNNDNDIIDRVITEHTSDSVIHITDEERQYWNTFVQMGMYFGNGSVSRVIELDCEFDVSFAIVFAKNRPLSISRFSDSKKYNYAAFVGRYAASSGAEFSDDFKSIIVEQSASPSISNEYMNLNETGVAYCYILFR